MIDPCGTPLIPIASPEGCVLVRLRHESDDGPGHVLGWFRLEAIGDVAKHLPSPLYFVDDDAEADPDAPVKVQVIAQNGAAWVELVIADGGDDDE